MGKIKYNPLLGLGIQIKETIKSDIPVVLSSGRSLGKYVNGDTIPSAGKTFEEVLNDMSQEFLEPTFSSCDPNRGSIG